MQLLLAIHLFPRGAESPFNQKKKKRFDSNNNIKTLLRGQKVTKDLIFDRNQQGELYHLLLVTPSTTPEIPLANALNLMLIVMLMMLLICKNSGKILWL